MARKYWRALTDDESRRIECHGQAPFGCGKTARWVQTVDWNTGNTTGISFFYHCDKCKEHRGGRIMGRLLTEIWRDLAKLKHELRSGNWYDYTKQAWVRGGRYVNCGHIDPFCGCYGRIHQGELASEAVLRDQLKALEAERAEAEYRFWMRGASVATRNVGQQIE